MMDYGTQPCQKLQNMFNCRHINAGFIVVILAVCRAVDAPQICAVTPTHEISIIARPEAIEAITAITSTTVEKNGPCPVGTVLVEGEYCPNVEQVCLEWVDSQGNANKEAIPKPGQSRRCGTWKFPTKCLSEHTVHKRFCIDKYEYPNVKGQRPKSWMTWYDIKSACEAQGKRLCTRSEWTFACEGPDMKPYPYGDGYHRDRTSCNTDRLVPEGINVMKVMQRLTPDGQALDALLTPSGSKEACVSPFGVYDMVGNIDEFVVNESGHPYISGLMGGHVFGVRNACRPMTEAHGPNFSWYETGGRCCSDAINTINTTNQ
jgi:hypothetical protein